MTHDVGYIHHVGLCVDDMVAALELYRQLGFMLPAPAYPTMPRVEGGEPEPFGVANTHATFERNFVEMLTIVKEDGSTRIPDDATLLPLQVPPEMRATIEEKIETTVAGIRASLERFEGLHVLVFQSSEPDATAQRISDAGVEHTGVNTVQRPIVTPDGLSMEALRFLEVTRQDGDDVKTPEGRIAFASSPDGEVRHATGFMDHPNGAYDLVEAWLCVSPDELGGFEARYEAYTGRTASASGPARSFQLDGSALTLVADGDLDAILPGEKAPGLPALVAYAVAVRDVGATRALLTANGFPVTDAPSGDIFVPASAALGGAVVFRQG
jgi:hypothetical protein